MSRSQCHLRKEHFQFCFWYDFDLNNNYNDKDIKQLTINKCSWLKKKSIFVSLCLFELIALLVLSDRVAQFFVGYYFILLARALSSFVYNLLFQSRVRPIIAWRRKPIRGISVKMCRMFRNLFTRLQQPCLWREVIAWRRVAQWNHWDIQDKVSWSPPISCLFPMDEW